MIGRLLLVAPAQVQGRFDEALLERGQPECGGMPGPGQMRRRGVGETAKIGEIASAAEGSTRSRDLDGGDRGVEVCQVQRLDEQRPHPVVEGIVAAGAVELDVQGIAGAVIAQGSGLVGATAGYLAELERRRAVDPARRDVATAKTALEIVEAMRAMTEATPWQPGDVELDDELELVAGAVHLLARRAVERRRELEENPLRNVGTAAAELAEIRRRFGINVAALLTEGTES